MAVEIGSTGSLDPNHAALQGAGICWKLAIANEKGIRFDRLLMEFLDDACGEAGDRMLHVLPRSHVGCQEIEMLRKALQVGQGCQKLCFAKNSNSGKKRT
jgi:hypothetical protein